MVFDDLDIQGWSSQDGGGGAGAPETFLLGPAAGSARARVRAAAYQLVEAVIIAGGSHHRTDIALASIDGRIALP